MSRRWNTREELVSQVVLLARQKIPRRAIARAMGVSRNTVKQILVEHEDGRTRGEPAISEPAKRAPRPSKLDGFKPRISDLLKQYTDITAQRIFEILRTEGFDGGYTAVKKHLRTVRPKAHPKPSLPTPEYGPGEMAESDWSTYAVRFADHRTQTLQAFSYVLVHSRRKHFGLYESNDLHALMDGHAQTFARFGGCARACKHDSQKPVVLRWEGNQPIYNPRFLAFASHYEFRPLAVRRGHPNDKPRTERSFWEFERSFLNGRTFRDLADMRAQLERWLDEVVDQRRLQKRTPLERFAEERDHLVPMPQRPYDTARVIYRVCSIDGFVAWEGNRYAVPHEHVTDILPLRITQRELFVYAADLHCIARHELAPRGAGLKLDPAGLHPPAQRRSVIDLDQLRAAFERIGERGKAFFNQMSQSPPRTWSAQARQILLLRERYTTDDLERALGHALAFGAIEYAAIERILAARAAPRTLDEYVTEETTLRLERTLGRARTQPRDLTEYDRLAALAPGRPGQEPLCQQTEAQPAADTTPSTRSSNDSSDTSNSSD